jgi:hypothetical protein
MQNVARPSAPQCISAFIMTGPERITLEKRDTRR